MHDQRLSIRRAAALLLALILPLSGCAHAKGSDEAAFLDAYAGEYLYAGVAALSAFDSRSRGYAERELTDDGFTLDADAYTPTDEGAAVQTPHFIKEALQTEAYLGMDDALTAWGLTTQYALYDGELRTGVLLCPVPDCPALLLVINEQTTPAGGALMGALKVYLKRDAKETLHPVQTEPPDGLTDGKAVLILDDGSCLVKDADCETLLVRGEERIPLGVGFGGLGVTQALLLSGKLYYSYSWGSGLHRSELACLGTDGVERRLVEFHYASYGKGDELLLVPSPDGIRIFSADAETNDGEEGFLSVTLTPREYLGRIDTADRILPVGVGSEAGLPSVTVGKWSVINSSWGVSVQPNGGELREEDYELNASCSAGTLCLWDAAAGEPIPLEEATAIDAALIWLPPNGDTTTAELNFLFVQRSEAYDIFNTLHLCVTMKKNGLTWQAANAATEEP